MPSDKNIDNAFFLKMKELLCSDFDAFSASLEKERTRGLRANTLKISAEDLSAALGVKRRVPFEPNGFFIDEKYGLHPYHHAGLFYLQEPSAMLPVAAISPYLKGNILDLCAAPGGKSTQIAGNMHKGSFLVSNEIVSSRAAVLSSNLERMGSAAAVTCMSPAELEKRCPDFFDAIVVDAPCSGEGMFRKERAAIRDWSLQNVYSCAVRQFEILCSAANMLASGGHIVYSTCTLNDVENEGVISKFLSTHSDFSLVEPSEEIRSVAARGFGIREAMRLFPHTFEGEGHFACLLRKNNGYTANNLKTTALSDVPKACERQIADILAEFGANLKGYKTAFYGNTVYIVSENFSIPTSVRLLRCGIPALEVKEKHILPLHGLAMFLKRYECPKAFDLAWDSQLISKYLSGEQLDIQADFSGFGVISVEGYPLGIVKSSGGALKNHYPKGLRIY